MKAPLRFLLAGLALLLGLTSLIACEVAPSEPPALPSGFTGDLPDTALDGFIYINQGVPFTLPANVLSSATSLVVNSLSLSFAPSQPEEAVGMVVNFASPASAQGAFNGIPETSNRWKQLSGSDLLLVIGPGAGAEALKQAFANGAFAKLATKEPDVWKGVQRLPSQPPAKPVGMGYIKPTPQLIERLKKGAPSAGDVSGAVEQAKIDFSVLALYSDKVVDLGSVKSAADFQATGAGAILVAKMGIPSITVSTVFNTVARLVGLEKATFDSEEAWTRNLEGLSLLLKAKSGYIYGAAAASQDFAWKLLQSALIKK